MEIGPLATQGAYAPVAGEAGAHARSREKPAEDPASELAGPPAGRPIAQAYTAAGRVVEPQSDRAGISILA